MSSSRAHRSSSHNDNSHSLGQANSGGPGRDLNEPQFALPGDPASASRGGGGRMQFGAAGSGVGRGPSGLSFMKERGSTKFAFGGGGSNSNSSMYPPPSQQQPISSSHQHHEEPQQQQQQHHQKRSLLTEPKRKKNNHHQQEVEEVENNQEEEEILIVVERREEHSRGAGGSHRHHQHQQQDEEAHHHGDVESPPLSQPSASRYQDQDHLNSDYVDDEEDDQDRDRRGGGAGDRDTEDECIQRKSWKQEPEAEAEMEVEQEHQQHEQEHEMKVDDGAGEQGDEDGGARSGEHEANVQGGERESQLPYSKLYLKIAQSDLYAQQHKVFDEKWAAVDADDEERWVQGGDKLVEKVKGVLDRVRDHVMERMKLYTTIGTHIVDHKSELVSNATTLDSTASQLSSWGNHIVESVNIKSDGKQPSSSA